MDTIYLTDGTGSLELARVLDERCDRCMAGSRAAKPVNKDPIITVPAITLEGDANGAPHGDGSSYAKKFSGKYSHRVIRGGVGHNLPQEAPEAFAQAVIDVDGYTSS